MGNIFLVYTFSGKIAILIIVLKNVHAETLTKVGKTGYFILGSGNNRNWQMFIFPPRGKQNGGIYETGVDII